MDAKDFVKGMKVVCVEGWKELTHIENGEVYTVAAMSYQKGTVKLEEIDGWWNMSRFQKAFGDKDHKFHVGQPVRCINEPPLGKVCYGMIYTVEKIYSTDSSIRLDGVNETHSVERFEPAYKLEVDCKVRVVDCTGYAKPYNDVEGTVADIGMQMVVLAVDGRVSYQFKPENLIVLEPAHSQIPGKMFDDDDLIHGMVFAQSAVDDITKKNIKMFLASTPYYGKQPMYAKYVHDEYQEILESCGRFKISKETLDMMRQDIKAGKLTFGSWDPELSEKFRTHLSLTLPSLTEEDFRALRESVKNMRIKIGGKNMKDIADNTLRELAEKMNDEYVGSDSNGNRGRGTVFLKKAGECAVETRDVSINLADKDVLALLKKKGIAGSLGDFQIQQYSNTLTVCVIKFKPLKKPEPENEED